MKILKHRCPGPTQDLTESKISRLLDIKPQIKRNYIDLRDNEDD